MHRVAESQLVAQATGDARGEPRSAAEHVVHHRQGDVVGVSAPDAQVPKVHVDLLTIPLERRRPALDDGLLQALLQRERLGVRHASEITDGQHGLAREHVQTRTDSEYDA